MLKASFAARSVFLCRRIMARVMLMFAILFGSLPIVNWSPVVANGPGNAQTISPNDNDPVVARQLYPQYLHFDDDGHVTTPEVSRTYELDVA